VTGPVQRFARQIASHGYIVAAPSSYHEFTGPEALAYDGPGTDAGNAWKIEKTIPAYDEDATLSVDLLTSLETCNGRIGELLHHAKKLNTKLTAYHSMSRQLDPTLSDSIADHFPRVPLACVSAATSPSAAHSTSASEPPFATSQPTSTRTLSAKARTTTASTASKTSAAS